MGIDARMFCKVRQETIDPEWLKLMSARLAREVGCEHFYQDRKTGEGALSLAEGYFSGPEGEQEHKTIPGKVWEQDGPDILAAKGEWFLEVKLRTRYYGVGYERGDLLVICAIAEWLEANIPGCEVWYGGDSSGVLAEFFGREQREELKRHFYSPKGQDYFNRDWFNFSLAKLAPPTDGCKLCVKEYYTPRRFGSGGGGDREYGAFHCAVCGEYFVTKDGGKTWGQGQDQQEAEKIAKDNSQTQE